MSTGRREPRDIAANIARQIPCFTISGTDMTLGGIFESHPRELLKVHQYCTNIAKRDVDCGRAFGSRAHRMEQGIYASIDRFSRQTVNIPVILHFFSNISRIFSSYTEKVSLCDDYSLPVDFVNKRRPASAAAATSTVQWTLPSPTVENGMAGSVSPRVPANVLPQLAAFRTRKWHQVAVCEDVHTESLSSENGRKQFVFCLQAEIEIVEQYSDPRDSKSKAYVEPGTESSLPTIYSRENRNYCRPYTGDHLFFAVDDTRRFDCKIIKFLPVPDTRVCRLPCNTDPE
ncbi:hypothetical protein ALC53_11767 [Atta colombica]|uniref:Uncharacterized protein n=1 Tax=Atta colombica TaxID=520822 RepID=A0A195AZX2_9HYME|nr:hypothetical protein ALC53_11767 [Atta colombica]